MFLSIFVLLKVSRSRNKIVEPQILPKNVSVCDIYIWYMALFYTIRRPPCSQCLQNQECTVQKTVLESKEEEEQNVVVVLKLISETVLSPSNVTIVWCAKNLTQQYSKNLLVKSSENDFIFLSAFYLII